MLTVAQTVGRAYQHAEYPRAGMHDLRRGTRVLIQPGRAKNTGRISVDYYSLDDFDRISAALGLTGDA